mmetsp:Transcript_14359/g.42381  ORF Transcript_14359/g.42381 Transcript_14359/m.42381 type:complete len:217 (+) Transcript_14359:1130-1780(+)
MSTPLWPPPRASAPSSSSTGPPRASRWASTTSLPPSCPAATSPPSSAPFAWSPTPRPSPRPCPASTTSSTSCTPSAPSSTGTSARAWRRESSLRPARTLPPSRKTTRRSAPTRPTRRRRRSTKQGTLGLCTGQSKEDAVPPLPSPALSARKTIERSRRLKVTSLRAWTSATSRFLVVQTRPRFLSKERGPARGVCVCVGERGWVGGWCRCRKYEEN